MNFQDFSSIDFEPRKEDGSGFVYVLCWVRDSQEIPFYVGQTSRIWGRLDDYYWGMFSASTDFKVSESVRHLLTKGHHVVVKHRPSPNPRGEELEIIAALHSEKLTLLNDLAGFKYKEADESAERAKIHNFLDALLPH